MKEHGHLWDMFPMIMSKAIGMMHPTSSEKSTGVYKCHRCGSKWINSASTICEKCGEINPEFNPKRDYGISGKRWEKNVDEAYRLFEGKITPLNEMPSWEDK